ncbi:TIGR04282 family arsenosugar biosynthesis glycosyltransferase [Calycomorphotria hydatis]|uniref:2-phospho-L-lactate guanylyltransferase n=1 Tax=Calycomorphotria hydatis TaxID=2528027 RepID=A0A517TD38_9PLAN|nr:DUF2064 domain-containing protein [Calycomorphotria hydatis]QDT66278.1 hypothetical protein V22_35430 [Calycomorphotria hydatis]
MSENGCIAVFVKTPELSPVKTRLAAGIGEAAAREFYIASVKAVEALVANAREEFGLTPFWAVAEEEALSHERWHAFESISQGTGQLGDRLHHVYEQLVDRFDFVLFIGADAPQLTLSLLKEADSVMDSHPFAISRTDDGGYSLFAGGKQLPANVWRSVPYSAETTAEEFCLRLRQFGEVAELETTFDVDDLQTLQRLADHSAEGLLPAQIEAIELARQFSHLQS